MKNILSVAVLCVSFMAGCGPETRKSYTWDVHDMNRPRPEVITPGQTVSQAPSNAVILFDGTDASEWQTPGGAPCPWKIENGYMEVVPKTNSIATRRSFGDCQLHIEWATPAQIEGESQHRGNSGVFLMGRYEVQILDSFNNDTYPDGQAGALYGQQPPLFNACRAPGRWQTYDIFFKRPHFDKKGHVIRPAYITVMHNGVCIQNNVALEGTTFHKVRSYYEPHADQLPIMLQDHGVPIRFRNIWIVELPDNSQ